MNTLRVSCFIALLSLAFSGFGQTGAWSFVTPTNTCTARHECSFGQVGDKFYLLGGRGIKPVEAYDLGTNTWTALGNTPEQIHHFQATEFYGLMYIVGAFRGNFPSETGIPFVYIYDPLSDTWFNGPSIPTARVRGSTGLVLYNDKFYVVAGIIDGHRSGWVPWLDEFDPATNTWTVLPDAPRPRDHFAAVVVDDKLVCAGGRRSGDGTGFLATFQAVVPETDVYDFSTGTWSTLPSPLGNIPTGRAGCSAVALDGEVVVIGGESASQSTAHKQTEALDLNTGTWRTLADLNTGRHGSQAILNNGGIYMVAGSGNRGGSPELNSLEVFFPGAPTTPTGVALLAGVPAAGSFAVPPTLAGAADTFALPLEHASGNQAILVHDLLFSGDSALSLLSDFTYPLALAPGKNLPLSLRFAPDAQGPYSGELRVVYGANFDTLAIAVNGVSPVPCNALLAPSGQSVSFTATKVRFTWNEVSDAVRCEIQGRQVGATSFARSQFGVPPHQRDIPRAFFTPGTDYEWRVRCACNLSPLEVTPYSSLQTFSVPLSREGITQEGAWVLYPSPVRTQLHLRVPHPADQLELQWLDVLGRSWGRLTLGSVQAGEEIRLERPVQSPAGQYFVRMTSATEVHTWPVLVE